MSDKLNELYAKKGQLITTQEILQSQLKEINKGIGEELNKPAGPIEEPATEESKEEDEKDPPE